MFGLGSRAYPNFCAFGKTVDEAFEVLGGRRIHKFGEGDELCGQEKSFKQWSKGVFQVGAQIGTVRVMLCSYVDLIVNKSRLSG